MSTEVPTPVPDWFILMQQFGPKVTFLTGQIGAALIG